MKLIVAIIPGEKLASVQAALNGQNLYQITVSEVLDCGRSEASTEIYRGRQFRRPVSKVRLEIAVEDSSMESALAALSHAGGRVFVMRLDDSAQVSSAELACR